MRIKNTLLTIIAALLLINLGALLAPIAHAIPRTQYKAVGVNLSRFDNSNAVQQALDQQAAEGWQYAGEAGSSLIFKK